MELSALKEHCVHTILLLQGTTTSLINHKNFLCEKQANNFHLKVNNLIYYICIFFVCLLFFVMNEILTYK